MSEHYQEVEYGGRNKDIERCVTKDTKAEVYAKVNRNVRAISDGETANRLEHVKVEDDRIYEDVVRRASYIADRLYTVVGMAVVEGSNGAGYS